MVTEASSPSYPLGARGTIQARNNSDCPWPWRRVRGSVHWRRPPRSPRNRTPWLPETSTCRRWSRSSRLGRARSCTFSFLPDGLPPSVRPSGLLVLRFPRERVDAGRLAAGVVVVLHRQREPIDQGVVLVPLGLGSRERRHTACERVLGAGEVGQGARVHRR